MLVICSYIDRKTSIFEHLDLHRISNILASGFQPDNRVIDCHVIQGTTKTTIFTIFIYYHTHRGILFQNGF